MPDKRKAKNSPDKNKNGKRKANCPKECLVNLSCDITSNEFKEHFRELWIGKGSCSPNDNKLIRHICQPFNCFQLRELVSDEEFLRSLRDELRDLEPMEKNNDLYKFHQTSSLNSIQKPHIQALKRLLFTDLNALLQEITGIALSTHVDMGCSQYQHTDTLLCHDDQLEGRRIAFVFYLTPNWNEDDGGLLQLFSTNDSGRPDSVAESLVPEFNSLVLFEVSPVSFHHVSEVLSQDKIRLSVNGWFHGPSLPRPEPIPRGVETPVAQPPCHITEKLLYSWVNPVYLAEEMQTSVRQQFEDDSEIQLVDFLLPERYAELCTALRDDRLHWQLCGPADRRRVELLEDECLTAAADSPLSSCCQLFRSEAIMLILSQLTGLDLHALATAAEASETGSDEEAATSSRTTEDRDRTTESSMTTTVDSSTTTDSSATMGNSGTAIASNIPAAESDTTVDCDSKNAPTVGRCRCEIRRWRCGNYSLLSDLHAAEMALDVRFFADCDLWQDEWGGFTSYIARDEDDELLSVSPQSNTLCLVYRDRNTLKFTKYVNSASPAPFYDVSCTYYERTESS